MLPTRSGSEPDGQHSKSQNGEWLRGIHCDCVSDRLDDYHNASVHGIRCDCVGSRLDRNNVSAYEMNWGCGLGQCKYLREVGRNWAGRMVSLETAGVAATNTL